MRRKSHGRGKAPGALGNRRWSNERALKSVDRNDGEMGEEAREAPRASQTVAQHFSGNGEPLKVFERGSDLMSHLSGEEMSRVRWRQGEQPGGDPW